MTVGHDTAVTARQKAGNLVLEGAQARDGRLGHVEKVVQLRARERGALARALDLHDAAVCRAHEVEVDVRVAVLGIVEVKQGHTANDAGRDGRDLPRERAAS